MGKRTIKKVYKRKLLFIAYSDIHHNIWGQFNKDNQRLKVSFKVEKTIFKEAQSKKCPVLFAGDLLHLWETISNELLSEILPHYKNLSNYDVRWLGISGNHDQSTINTEDNISPSWVKTFCSVFDNFTCIDFKSYEHKNIHIHGIPYLTHDEGLLEAIKKIKRGKGKNILMLHTTLPDTKDTNGRLIQTNTIGKEVMEKLDKFDLVLVGHVHKPMKLGKKKHIIQLGAPNQQRKTDKDCDLGYWEIYDDMSVKFREIKSPKFIELEPEDKIPDGKNYYYHKLEEKVNNEVSKSNEKKFKDIDNKKLLATSYLKERGIKNTKKKRVLIEILKDEDND